MLARVAVYEQVCSCVHVCVTYSYLRLHFLLVALALLLLLHTYMDGITHRLNEPERLLK